VSNALDALDRLYDRECQPIDVWALVEATADAVTPGALADALRTAASELRTLLWTGLTHDEQYTRALAATGELRFLLAHIWSATQPEAREIPKGLRRSALSPVSKRPTT
jgi:hypothetical protein